MVRASPADRVRDLDGIPPRSQPHGLLRAGGVVHYLSLAGLIALNLLLPVVMGREAYSSYVLIMATAFIAQAGISVPADTAFLKLFSSDAGAVAGRRQYMPAKIVLSAGAAAALGSATGLSSDVIAAVVVFAAGHTSLTATLHESYLVGSARDVVWTGVGMSVSNVVIPFALAQLLTPALLAITAGACGIGACWLLQRRLPIAWTLPGICAGARLLVRGLRVHAWASYLNSAVPWLAVLRIGVTGASLTGPLKLAFSVMNGGQGLIPLTSSAVLAATAGKQGAERARMIRRLWTLTFALSSLIALAVQAATPLIDRFYGAEFPELESLIPLAAAGITASTIYWVFWPLSGPSRSGDAHSWPLSAATGATAIGLAVAGSSLASSLGIYLAGVTTGALIASVRAGVGRWSALLLVPPLVLASQYFT